MLMTLALLIPPTVAAEPAVSTAVFGLMPERGMGAGSEGGGFTIENLGSVPGPALRITASGLKLLSPATVVIQPGTSAEIRIMYDGPCGLDSYSGCGSGWVQIAGPGGSFSVQVTVYPPNLGVLGMRPPRTWWNGIGPLPPSAPARSWGQGLGASALWADLGPKYGPLMPTVLETAKGPVDLSIRVQLGVPATAGDAAAQLAREVIQKCEAARTEPHSKYGEDGGFSMVWGPEAVVSAIEYSGGSWDPGLEPCIARATVGHRIPAAQQGSATAAWTTARTE